MTSLNTVIGKLKTIQEDYTKLVHMGTSSLNSRVQTVGSSSTTQGESRDLKRRKAAADQVFFDKQKQHGDVGVGRQLTLQEVVITLFFFSIIFFSISLAVHQFITTQSILSVLKVLGLCILLALVLISFVVRYA